MPARTEDCAGLTPAAGSPAPAATAPSLSAAPTPSWRQLDVLSCNVFGAGEVSGEVLVNGRPLDPARFAKLSSYVPQRDVLDASSTVGCAHGPGWPSHGKASTVEGLLPLLPPPCIQEPLPGARPPRPDAALPCPAPPRPTLR